MGEAEEVFEAGGLTTVELTSDIVSAYVSNNRVPTAELSALVASVHAAIAGLGAGVGAEAAPAVERPTPAQVRKSITPDGLVSFIDGKSYQALKRHLNRNGLDPRGYRERYGLPADYPMTSPTYSARRSELARAIGLGQGSRKPIPAPEAEPVQAPAVPKKRGGRKA